MQFSKNIKPVTKNIKKKKTEMKGKGERRKTKKCACEGKRDE